MKMLGRFSDFASESRAFDREVDTEAAKAVRDGHSPWDAKRIAIGRVKERRQSAARDRAAKEARNV